MSLVEEFKKSGLIAEKFMQKKEGEQSNTNEPPPKIDDTKDQVIPEPEPEEDDDSVAAESYNVDDVKGLKAMLEACSWGMGKLNNSWETNESEEVGDKKQILIEMSAKIDEYKQVVEGWCK